MSPRKRPSLEEIANAVGEIGRVGAPRGDGPPPDAAPEEPSPPPVDPETYWRKYTVPYRSEQLAELERLLARWAADKQVKVSLAEVIRLALDQMIERMEAQPDEVILALHRQEQREQADIPTRKYSRSRGAARYLKRKNLL